MDYVKEAKALGFTQAALMPVSELVIVPEYRMFCGKTCAATIMSCLHVRPQAARWRK